MRAVGCVKVKDAAALLMLAPYGRPTVDPPPLGPFYAVGRPWHHGEVFYVPSAGMVASATRARTLTSESDVVWLRVDARTRAVLATLARTVEPYPQPLLTRARLGAHVLGGEPAASYARLWREPGTPVAPSYDRGDWLALDVESQARSPWTLERPELLYSPAGDVLERGRTLLRVPGDLAADLEAGRPLVRP